MSEQNTCRVGHPDLNKRPEVKAWSFLSNRGQSRRLQSSNQRVYEKSVYGAGGLKNGQVPTNCNRGSFIIVPGSMNNTLYLWSSARQSGIVWEVLRSADAREGETRSSLQLHWFLFAAIAKHNEIFLGVQIVLKSFLTKDYSSLLAKKLMGPTHLRRKDGWRG